MNQLHIVAAGINRRTQLNAETVRLLLPECANEEKAAVLCRFGPDVLAIYGEQSSWGLRRRLRRL